MFKRISIVAVALLLFGCATGKQYIFTTPSPINDVSKPTDNMAQVVFLRPSKGVMGILSAFVLDVTDGENSVIGVTPAKSKFVVNMKPGEHRLFSTQGMQGHIMELNVEAGERYYVLVRPIYGNGFQLRPLKRITDNEFGQNNTKFKGWLSDTKLVGKGQGADEWYADSFKSINKIIAKAEKVWSEKSMEQKAQLTLIPSDSQI